MTHEETRAVLKAQEVMNKFSGGCSLEDVDPEICPWCNSASCGIESTRDQDSFWDYYCCADCSKRWVLGYELKYYEEIP
tara:strand:+ start:640 stop:876 length:237 start_codon:yes stop_codon:yes gene_type:complete